MRVAPFGHPRINGYVRLPAAFRSLSRPSSAPSAKAFTLRSFSLDLAASMLAYIDTSHFIAFLDLSKHFSYRLRFLTKASTPRFLSLSFVCAFHNLPPKAYAFFERSFRCFVYAVFKVRRGSVSRSGTDQSVPNGDEGIRTPDPLLARQVLSQLSYTPIMLASTCSPIPSPV